MHLVADLDGKRIIVTGTASGIGRAVALRVAAGGARVAAFDRHEAAGAATVAAITAAGGTARHHTVDVAQEETVAAATDEAVAWLGGLDAVLHVAGVISGIMQDIEDLTGAVFDHVQDVNLKGSFLVAKHAARIMKPQRRGVIVLTASGAGVVGGSASIAYAPSKGGVHGLAMALAQHLAKYGIRVNDVCPGKVDTAMISAGREEAFRNTGHRPAPPQPDGSGSPFLYEGNLSDPAGVAEVFAFLASDRAALVRGSIFTL
jgi:NAD(P)-dependent dehydrogenase (short-subunit alcohol dehydrogenase family)